MRILFTGASSFTGYWFASALHEAGHEVTAVCREPRLEAYDGVRRRRLELLAGRVRAVFGLAFGDDRFVGLLRESEPFDVICHHGATAADHKAGSFDLLGAVERNTRNFPAVVDAAGARNLRALVLTGTYFEPDEGQGSAPLRAFSPYGLSKALTWQIARYHCETRGLPLGKFVLPNPIGPLDEPRFLGYLLATWARGGTAVVRTPEYTRDNAPVDPLARAYATFVARAAEGTTPVSHASPSGWVETVGGFATRVRCRIRALSGRACALELAVQTEFAEPRARANTEPLLAGWPAPAEEAFWARLWAEHAPQA